MSGFKGIGIWPINPSNSKFDPSTLYTLQNQAMEEEEAKQEDGEQNWTKHIVVKEFINIGSIIEVPIASLFKYQLRYYVNMPKIPIVTNHASIIESENMVENLAQPSLDEIIKF